MPNSQADVALDWRGLIDATDNPDLLPHIQAERDELVLTLDQVGALIARQNELRGLRQETTQNLRSSLARGKELAIQIRSMVRGKIGPRSELLVRYNMAPIRKRSRKATGEVPAVKPVA